jgi:predicted RecA/RadA family phage recombinase
MAANGVQDGCVLDWTNGTAADVVSGQAVAFGMLGMAIALVNIAISAVGSVAMEGVFTLTKASGAISQGDKLWYNSSTKAVTNAPALGYWFIGYAVADADSGDTQINVSIEEFANESVRVLTLAATGTQAISASDFTSGKLVLLVPNTAAKTITLPPVANIQRGATLIVKKTDAAAFAITLDPNASETIDGGATYTAMDAANDHAEFINNGTSWTLLNAVIA